MSKFYRQANVVDAFQWTGGPDQLEDPEWICEEIRKGTVTFEKVGTPDVLMRIPSSLGGHELVHPGEWVVRLDGGGLLSMISEEFHSKFLPLGRMTFIQLQQQVSVWSRKNFFEQPSYRPLLGIQEECGELSHAHLKAEQGIRGTPEKHRAAKEDAIGDLVIFLADYCHREGISLQECVEKTWEQVSKRDWVGNPQTGTFPNGTCPVSLT